MLRKILGMDTNKMDIDTDTDTGTGTNTNQMVDMDIDATSGSTPNIYNLSNIEDILYNKKVPVLLVIHSESCPACQQFMPQWGNICDKIVKENPNATNMEERNTPMVGSIYSENMNKLHDLYDGESYDEKPLSIDDAVQYVPTIMKLIPNGNKVKIVKYNKKRTLQDLIGFYNDFKKEMGVSGVQSNKEPNISLQIQSGGYKSNVYKTPSKRKKHKKKTMKKNPKRTKHGTRYKKRFKSKSKSRKKTRTRTRKTSRKTRKRTKTRTKSTEKY